MKQRFIQAFVRFIFSLTTLFFDHWISQSYIIQLRFIREAVTHVEDPASGGHGKSLSLYIMVVRVAWNQVRMTGAVEETSSDVAVGKDPTHLIFRPSRLYLPLNQSSKSFL